MRRVCVACWVSLVLACDGGPTHQAIDVALSTEERTAEKQVADERDVAADDGEPKQEAKKQEAKKQDGKKRTSSKTKRPAAESQPKPATATEAEMPQYEGPCCRTCRKGKACGDSCIARDRECTMPPGCACNG